MQIRLWVDVEPWIKWMDNSIKIYSLLTLLTDAPHSIHFCKMRKSSAPSRKQNAEQVVSSAPQKAVLTATRSGSSGKLCKFKAVYAKASTRKHKTFTDDGTVEIQDLKVTLKDKYGRVSKKSSIEICWLFIAAFPHLSQSTSDQLVLSILSSFIRQFKSVDTSFKFPMKYSFHWMNLQAKSSKQTLQAQRMRIQINKAQLKWSSTQFTAKSRQGCTKSTDTKVFWKSTVTDWSWRTSEMMWDTLGLFLVQKLMIFSFSKFIGAAQSKIPVGTGSELQIGRWEVQVSDELKLENSQEKRVEAAIEPPSLEVDTEEESPEAQCLSCPESPNYYQDTDSPMYSPDSSENSSLCSIQTTIFKAIYGPASATRVHKVYTKDGTVECQGLKAVLKNSKEKVSPVDTTRVLITTFFISTRSLPQLSFQNLLKSELNSKLANGRSRCLIWYQTHHHHHQSSLNCIPIRILKLWHATRIRRKPTMTKTRTDSRHSHHNNRNWRNHFGLIYEFSVSSNCFWNDFQ